MKTAAYRNAKTILILFIGFFAGVLFLYEGHDGYRHIESFQLHYVGLSFDEFIDELVDICMLRPEEGETNDDPYLHILSFTIGLFTSSKGIFFFIVGIIYGFFFINGVDRIFRHLRGRWGFYVTLFFFMFISWKSLEGINSIRNYTAAWCYFYGAVSFFQTKQRKYLLFVLVAPLIHFAYVVMTLPFYIILLLGNRNRVFLIILVVSFFANVSTDFLVNSLSKTELGKGKISYTADNYWQERVDRGVAVAWEKQSFHARYYLVAVKYSLTILLIIALFSGGYWKNTGHDHFLTSIASMAVLLLIFANLFSISYVLNKRLFINGGLYITSYLALLFHRRRSVKQDNLSVLRIGSILAIPTFLLFLFRQYSEIIFYADIRIFFSPLMAPFLEEGVSLRESIKYIISILRG